MKNLTALLIFLSLGLSSCRGDGDLPEGMEWINNIGYTHFVYAPEAYLSADVNLRDAGRVICTEKFDYRNYCEVYFWYNKQDISVKFPITNRQTLFAIFELKDGIMQLKKTKDKRRT